MDDLVRRAREMGGFSPDAELCSLMADEIERLRAALHKVLGIVGNFPVDRFEYNVIKEASTALGEKE